MRFFRFSNVPIVGRYVPCSDEENEAIEAVLTETQKGDLENGGWAEVEYQVGHIRWPRAVVKLDLTSKTCSKFAAWL